LEQILDIFLHLDKHLTEVVTNHGPWVYGILFAIIFAETGLVIMPFLPGDSLLFAVGALCATGTMKLWIAASVMLVAAILGDAVNYHVGKYIGPKVFAKQVDPNAKRTLKDRLLSRKHLDEAHRFFEKHGGKAVILARFVPIVRTFIPFVAGAGSMRYGQFFLYNVVGAFAWVGICMAAGYFFGNIPVVKRNFELVVIGIVGVSLLPIAFEFMKARKAAKAAGAVS
jgi:membrane-associated protein